MTLRKFIFWSTQGLANWATSGINLVAQLKYCKIEDSCSGSPPDKGRQMSVARHVTLVAPGVREGDLFSPVHPCFYT